jgi:hypothetical protein
VKRILALFLVAAVLATTARASKVPITITGTVLVGTDTTGVFGFPPQTDLSGKAYTLTFTFNDMLGNEQFTSTGSYIQSTPTSDPGTAVLQIGDGSFPFGTSSKSQSSARLTTDGAINSSYSLQAGEAVLDTSWNNIQETDLPAAGTLLTTKAIWEAPFL